MSTSVKITREVSLPDPVRLERCRKVPELGPRLLFFGGGTALRATSRRLVEYTHNSIHLLTPFDSGGSSARLRDAFRMPAVGDLRNRLMALADQSMRGQPEIFALFAFRFPADADQARLKRRLRRMVDGADPMVAAVEDPMRKLIRNHLRLFEQHMPRDFDLRGANIGNLILTGGYLNQNRHIDPVVFLFSRLVEVRGVVRPVASADLQLVAELESGEVLVGQHVITGKECAPIRSPIRRVYLSRKVRATEPEACRVREKVASLVHEADVICYPMGSFYSSLIASLLPAGIGQAIAETPVPKVFVPNTGDDPEQLGMTLPGAVESLLGTLRAGCDRAVPDGDLLHQVLVDVGGSGWPREQLEAVERMGVGVLDVSLVSGDSRPLLDPDLLAGVLVSMG